MNFVFLRMNWSVWRVVNSSIMSKLKSKGHVPLMTLLPLVAWNARWIRTVIFILHAAPGLRAAGHVKLPCRLDWVSDVPTSSRVTDTSASSTFYNFTPLYISVLSKVSSAEHKSSARSSQGFRIENLEKFKIVTSFWMLMAYYDSNTIIVIQTYNLKFMTCR